MYRDIYAEGDAPEGDWYDSGPALTTVRAIHDHPTQHPDLDMSKSDGVCLLLTKDDSLQSTVLVLIIALGMPGPQTVLMVIVRICAF